MDPITAAILIGAGTSLLSMHQSNQQQSAMKNAQRDQEKRMVDNQNQMVEEGFKKNRQARGLGGASGPAGALASQSGAALTSVTDGNAASII